MTRARESKTGPGQWRSAGVVAGCVVSYVLAQLIGDVFSARGIAYTLGLGDGTGLMWPDATALMTWGLLVESCALCGVAGNYFTGRWRGSLLVNLVFGHVTFACWTLRAARVVGIGGYRVACWALQRGRQSVPTPAPLDEPDDLESLVVDDPLSATQGRPKPLLSEAG